MSYKQIKLVAAPFLVVFPWRLDYIILLKNFFFLAETQLWEIGEKKWFSRK